VNHICITFTTHLRHICFKCEISLRIMAHSLLLEHLRQIWRHIWVGETRMCRNVTKQLIVKVTAGANAPVTYGEFGRKSKCVHYVNGTFFVVKSWKLRCAAHLGTFQHAVYECEVQFGISAILRENVPFEVSHFTYFHRSGHISVTHLWIYVKQMWITFFHIFTFH